MQRLRYCLYEVFIINVILKFKISLWKLQVFDNYNGSTKKRLCISNLRLKETYKKLFVRICYLFSKPIGYILRIRFNQQNHHPQHRNEHSIRYNHVLIVLQIIEISDSLAENFDILLHFLLGVTRFWYRIRTVMKIMGSCTIKQFLRIPQNLSPITLRIVFRKHGIY